MTTDIPDRFYEQARSIRNGVIWESNAATRVLAEALYAAWEEGVAQYATTETVTPAEDCGHGALSSENERLRKALRPFAEAAENLDDDHKDTSAIWESPAAMSIDAGDLREARRALEGGE